MNSFKNLKLVYKIGGGFGLIIIILIVVFGISNNNLSTLNEDANIVNVASRLNQEALDLRGQVSDYMLNPTEDNASEINRIINEMNNTINSSQEEYSNRDRLVELMVESETLLDGYYSGINHFFEITNRRSEIRNFYTQQENILLNTSDELIDRRITAVNQVIERERPTFQIMQENNFRAYSNQLRRLIDEITRISRDYLLYIDDYETRISLYEEIENKINQAYSVIEEVQPQIINMDDISSFTNIEEALYEVEVAFDELVTLEAEADEIEDNLLISGGQFINYMEEVQDTYQNSFNQVRADFSRDLLVSAIIALIIALLTSIIVTRGITGPISRLVEVAEAGKKGDLTKDINIDQKDEIGILADSFQQMINNLRQMINHIQEVSNNLAASSQEMSASSEEMSASASEVGRAIEEVASGAQEQSAQVQDTKYIINQLTTEINKIKDMSINMDKEADQVVKNINNGNKAVKDSIEEVMQVKVRSKNVSKSINELGDLSNKIGEIIEIINGISAQTNLLALNAAIEAARAGEAGRGFSVVADEIRELAEESSKSTEEIGRLIERIQNGVNSSITEMKSTNDAVSSSVESIEKTENSFKEIREVAKSLENMIEDITQRTELMSKSSNKVDRSVEEVAAISDQSSANAEEVSASSEEQAASTIEIVNTAESLAEMAEELAKTIAEFKIK